MVTKIILICSPILVVFMALFLFIQLICQIVLWVILGVGIIGTYIGYFIGWSRDRLFPPKVICYVPPAVG